MISAPPDKVYAVLADYHEGHPNVLPKRYFKSLIVEQGGKGAGTVIHVQLSVMGVRRESHMRVSEPEPGRVLTETDLETGLVTSFIVSPAPQWTHPSAHHHRLGIRPRPGRMDRPPEHPARATPHLRAATAYPERLSTACSNLKDYPEPADGSTSSP